MKECGIDGCSKKRERGKSKCSMHRKRVIRKKYPIRDAYRNLKSNAKRRGIEFDLTLEQWRELCLEHDWLERRGIDKDCITIDRIDHLKGYTLDNVQFITLEENCIKANVEKAITRRIRREEAPRNSWR